LMELISTVICRVTSKALNYQMLSKIISELTIHYFKLLNDVSSSVFEISKFK
jgi:hypothetical protein